MSAVSKSSKKSAINGGVVDINHLEQEIQADLASYRQHKAQDGMKKRAIHTSWVHKFLLTLYSLCVCLFFNVTKLIASSSIAQWLKGKDYSEFRHFVSVSQLKPTSGREVSNLFNGAATGSISSSSRSKNEGDNTSTTIGGFDDIIQRRKEDAFSNASSTSKSIKNLDKNLQSLLLGNVATTSKSNAGNNQIAKTSRAAHDFLKEWKRPQSYCTSSESEA